MLKFFSLPTETRLLTVRALVMLSVSRVSLHMLSVQKTLQVLKWITPDSGTLIGDKQAYREKVSWAVDAIARRMLNDRTCLTQALTVKRLLNARNIPATLWIGVAKKEDGKLLAHAWIESDDIVVIGGPKENLSGLTRMPAFEWMAS